jgi:hypothetical protein
VIGGGEDGMMDLGIGTVHEFLPLATARSSAIIKVDR